MILLDNIASLLLLHISQGTQMAQRIEAVDWYNSQLSFVVKWQTRVTLTGLPCNSLITCGNEKAWYKPVFNHCQTLYGSVGFPILGMDYKDKPFSEISSLPLSVSLSNEDGTGIPSYKVCKVLCLLIDMPSPGQQFYYRDCFQLRAGRVQGIVNPKALVWNPF